MSEPEIPDELWMVWIIPRFQVRTQSEGGWIAANDGPADVFFDEETAKKFAESYAAMGRTKVVKVK